eukprot:5432784-Pyramimonas_sp.AAC.1
MQALLHVSRLAPKRPIPRSGITYSSHHSSLKSKDGILISAGQFDGALGTGGGEMESASAINLKVAAGVGGGSRRRSRNRKAGNGSRRHEHRSRRGAHWSW